MHNLTSYSAVREGKGFPTLPIKWPGDKKVAVMITIALELWSEGHWPIYAPMAASWPLPGVLDTHSISWSEYGAKVGVWRLLDILATRGMPATFGISGLVADRFPEAVLGVYRAGHEIAAHSYSQDIIPARLDAAAERENIVRCSNIFEKLTGSRPTGWANPRGTGTQHTDQLLAENGYQWIGDYNDEELPYVRSTAGGPLVALMHSDFTDVRGAMAGPRGYRDVHKDLLDYLLAVPESGILNLTIHAHVGGRPLLATMFDQILQHIQLANDDVWIATHQQIAEHTLRSCAAPGGRS
jgi:peptidoglycan/xylan/chitin deacetylase (PgdA/CDA1 family)